MDTTFLSAKQISSEFIPIGISTAEFFLLIPTYIQPSLNPDTYRIAYLRERIDSSFTKWKKLYLRDLETALIALPDLSGVSREIQIRGSQQRDWTLEFYQVNRF